MESGGFIFRARRQGIKKASCRGDPQHKASLFTMIFFLFFFPAISDPDAQRECHFEDQREWEGTPRYHSYSMIDLWSAQHIVVFIII